jgi:hypothetical protein
VFIVGILVIGSGDEAGCAFAQALASSEEQVGPPANDTFESMAMNGAAALNAGDTPSIICVDLNSNPTTQFGEGNLNAILISSSNGGSNAAAAQSSSRKLTIVRP